MATFASLIGPGISIPQNDLSWMSNVGDSINGAIQRHKENKSFNKLADMIGAPPQGQQQQAQQPQQPGGLLSSLIAQPQQTMTAPVGAVERTAPQGDTYKPFIETVKTKITNPYGLAAVAATGRAESGWSPENANRTWSDPSQSGAAGTSGGIMSWRNERLQKLQAYAASKGEQPGNISPQTQAEYFLQEDPELVAKLNAAQSPQEAQSLMNNAWKFAGYDQPGGEAARRAALAQNYYASEFSDMPTSSPGAQAIQEQAPLPVGQNGQTAAPVGLPGVTPIQRGGVDPALIQFMLRDPNLREIGVKLWAQNVQGPNTAEPWQFVQGPDGTLLRANQQTGAIESVGNFGKDPNADLPNSYQEYLLAKKEGYSGTYELWQKQKAPNTSTNVNLNTPPAESETAKAAAKGLGDIFSSMYSDSQTARSDLASINLLRSSLANSPSGFLGAVTGLASDFGVNLGPNADQVQVAKAIIAKMVPAQRVPGSGSSSDRDLAFFLDGLPRLSGTDKGNAIILDTMQALAENKSAQGAIVSEYYTGAIDQKEAIKRLRELPDPFAGYKRLTQGQSDQQNGETPRRATNPQTGEIIELRNGKWVPLNGR